MITDIVPATHPKLGNGFIVRDETFLTFEQFSALFEKWKNNAHNPLNGDRSSPAIQPGQLESRKKGGK